MCLVTNQDLEKSTKDLYDIQKKFIRVCNSLENDGYELDYDITQDLYTIADYRRDFNEKYCELVDVLFWGESDMLVPSQGD